MFKRRASINGVLRRQRRKAVARKKVAGVHHRPAEAPSDPHRLAEAILKRKGTDHRGRLTLHHWGGVWWRYDGKRYVRQDKTAFDSMINAECKALYQQWNATDRRGYRLRVTTNLTANVIAALLSIPDVRIGPEVRQPAWLGSGDQKRELLALQNGLLNVGLLLEFGHQGLIPHTPEWFSPICLPYDFDPAATSPRWENFLDWMFEGDTERIRFVTEWFGYCVTMDTSQQRFVIFVGDGSNGKTVLLETLEHLVGRENVSAVALEDFGSEFRLAETIGKLVNIVSEIGDVTRLPEGKLKAFVAADKMSFNRKYRDPIEVNPTARLIFATNKVPSFMDKSEGIWRRLVIVPCDRQISDGEKDDKLPQKMRQELPGILNGALRALRNLRERGKFLIASRSEVVGKDHRLASDPERKFLSDECRKGDSVDCRVLYDRYREWCADEGHRALNDMEFGKAVRKVFPWVDRQRASTGSRPYRYVGISMSQASQDELLVTNLVSSNNQYQTRTTVPGTPETAETTPETKRIATGADDDRRVA
jgi:putative DNA primase/helicase